MCKADKIYYVTTCGGYIRDYNFGYDIVKALGKLFGVEDSKCITAEGLDIRTNDAKAILKETTDDLPNRI